MLHIPTNSRKTFIIGGTDPGTHNLGLGFLHVDLFNFRVKAYEAYTLKAEKLMDDDDYLVQTHGHTFARICALGDEIERRLRIRKPSVMACEAAYFHKLHPGAYGPLLMSINGIRDAIMRYNRFMPFHSIEPSVVKTAAGAHGAKGEDKKTAVLRGLQKNPEFQQARALTPLESLSDHAVDSLAIAYARLLQMR